MKTIGFTLMAGLIAAPALAQKIPSAEQGEVAFRVLVPENSAFETPLALDPGQDALRFEVRPDHGVRLTADVPKRLRPKGDPIAAGTVLFGVDLSSGRAYCAPIDRTKGVPKTQCLRDLDRDGDFDASYGAETRGSGSRYFASLLRGLSAASAAPYDAVDDTLLEAVPLTLVYRGVAEEGIAFKVRIEDDVLDNVIDCRVGEVLGECRFAGGRISYRQDGRSITIEDAELNDFLFSVRFTGILN
jgi:hypothetical protein